MKGGVVQHHKQTAYERGCEDTRLLMGHHLPMGIAIGVLIGGSIVLVGRWIGAL